MGGPTLLLGGRYEVRGVLGRGGMAEVRDGWDTRLDRAVAIKLLHPGLSADPTNRQRFEAEARSAAALNHPNIVAIHDSGEHERTPYIVMERLPGHTLADQIARGPMPEPQVRRMLDDILAGLTVAHDAGILHRDIKPGNILFTPSGQTKITDFGIAKTTAADYTVTGQIIGTLAYLSPERLAGKAATTGDDLYAVGVVGYETLTGRKPFPQEGLIALAHAIMAGHPPPLSVLRPDVDPVLATVIDRAMATEPERRFDSAATMRAALSAPNGALAGPLRPPTKVLTSPVLMPPPSMAYLPHHARRPPSATRRRNRTLLLGLAMTLAVLVTAVAFALDPSSQHSVPNPPASSTSTTPTTNTPTTTTTTTTPAPPRPPGNGQQNGEGD